MQTNLPNYGVGVQEPRILLRPSDFDAQLSADRAADMIDIAQIAGVGFDPWQQIGAEALTLTRADGRWAAFEAFLAANRQQGKGTIIEGRQLAGLFVWEESLQVYTAHEFKTAQEMFLRIRMLIESTPVLDRMVQRIRTADGEEAIETKSGCRLKFMARSNSSGRGFTAPTLYLDEAMKLKRRMVASLMPTMSALSLKGNPQLLYFSSAGEADSEVQEDVRERALSRTSDRLMYGEWSVPRWDELPTDERRRWPNPEAYRADPEVHRRANPGYNIRLDPEFVINTELEGMGAEEFDRERLGIWAKLGGESALPAADWAACLVEDSDLVADPTSGEMVSPLEAVERVAFAVDIPRSRDSATIVMAGALDAERSSVVVIDRREGTDWVPERLAELKARWSPVAIVLDELNAASTMLPQLRKLGVRPMWLKYREYAQACGRFYDSVTNVREDEDGNDYRLISHSGQKELDDAVASAKQKFTDGTLWKWDRSGTGDIAPLVAATLALHGLQSKRDASHKSKVKVVFG